MNGREVEDVEEFIYLGATVDEEGGGSKDIMNRLQKAFSVFLRLGKVWAARGIGRKTKIRLFKFERSCYMAVKRGRSQRLTNEN